MRQRVAMAALALAVVIAGCGAGGNAERSAEKAKAGKAAKSSRAARKSRDEVSPAAKRVRLVRIGTFNQPLYVTAPPGDAERIFVVEKGGRVRVVQDGRKLSDPFLSIADKVSTGEEQGLLSMAFAPDYEQSGKFYIDFTDNNGDTRIQEYERSGADPNRADPDSARQLLFIRQPFENHNGGQLQLGPDDLLYIGMGDGGSAGDPKNNAQSLHSLLGKLLRIDPRSVGGKPYRIPRTNPFVSRSGARPEIYSYGLRNPWRFSFDPREAIWIADVGQDKWEEIDYRPKGGAKGTNFGWSKFEGFAPFRDDRAAPGAVKPVAITSHSAGNCSITGGYVVRDKSLVSLTGSYVYGDFCKGRLLSLKVRNGRAVKKRSLGLKVDQLSSFGEDAQGRLYATSLDGPVYRLS